MEWSGSFCERSNARGSSGGQMVDGGREIHREGCRPGREGREMEVVLRG